MPIPAVSIQNRQSCSGNSDSGRDSLTPSIGSGSRLSRSESLTRRTMRKPTTPEFKAQAALERDKRLTELAPQHDIHSNPITNRSGN